MATSGTTTWTDVRSDIIFKAMMALGVIGADQVVSAADDNYCSSVLNDMIKAWQSMGLNLWLKDFATIFLNPNQNVYYLGGPNASNACVTNTYVTTTTTANVNIGDSSITLTTTTGIAAGYQIGLQLDNNTRQWFTVNTVNAITGVVTLTGGTATDTSASGSSIYCYPTTLTNPLDILDATYHYYISTERPINKVSEDEYFEIVNKAATGLPTQYMVIRQSNQLIFSVWPTPSVVNDTVNLKITRIVQDVTAPTQNLDFPPQWMEALIYNLALRIAPSYGKEDKAAKLIAPMAAQFLQELKEWDNEHANSRFMPNLSYYY